MAQRQRRHGGRHSRRRDEEADKSYHGRIFHLFTNTHLRLLHVLGARDARFLVEVLERWPAASAGLASRWEEQIPPLHARSRARAHTHATHKGTHTRQTHSTHNAQGNRQTDIQTDRQTDRHTHWGNYSPDLVFLHELPRLSAVYFSEGNLVVGRQIVIYRLPTRLLLHSSASPATARAPDTRHVSNAAPQAGQACG